MLPWGTLSSMTSPATSMHTVVAMVYNSNRFVMYDDTSMQIFQILIDVEPFIIGCFHHFGQKTRTILSLEIIKQRKQDLLPLLTLLCFLLLRAALYCPNHCHFLFSAICLVLMFPCLDEIII